MTVQVMWLAPAWGIKFQLSQKTVIIRITSQGVFTEYSSFKIIVTKLLQWISLLFEAIFSWITLLHVKTSYATHIFKKLPESKVIIFFNNLLPLIVLQK